VDHVEDRYYTPKEYKTLSKKAREKLTKMREERGESGNRMKKRKGGSPSLDKRTIKAIQTIAKNMEPDAESDDDESDDSHEDGEATQLASNRKNPALKRQKRSKK
jgi:hypothetical protein